MEVKFRRVLKIVGLSAAGVFLFIALLAAVVWWYLHPSITTTPRIVYTRRHGHDLTFSIWRPKNPNGLAVAVLVSGGWKSGPNGLQPWLVSPLLRQGYTLFAVTHLSQPEATISEITQDMHRAIRFIRHHANEYQIDPKRIAVTGGSAGGHLSLMLATRGSIGLADAPDPVDREDSSVQAVAIFFPCTDLLNLGASVQNPGDGGPPKSYVKAFGPGATNMATWKIIGRDLSPIDHIHAKMPPILIYHGDADVLTPLDQSERFQARARQLGNLVELIVHKGGGHGWFSMIWDIRSFGKWFDRHLKSAPGELHASQRRENMRRVDDAHVR